MKTILILAPSSIQSSRVQWISDEVGFRSSFGTGFRAPTPGQQGTTNVSTRLPDGTQ